MKSTYTVTFVDGSTEEVDADNGSQAKMDAQNRRVREVDPGGTMRPEDRKTHGRVKVVSVTEKGTGDASAGSTTSSREQRSTVTESDDERRARWEREDRERADQRERERRDRGQA